MFKGGSTDVYVAKVHPTAAALRVTIEPPAAVAAGGQWRRAGTSTWLDSGMTETGLTTGSQTIEFKQVADWAAPPNQTLMLAGTVTTATVGVYRLISGGVQVTLAPPEAVAAGAGWRRVGTANWQASGATETLIPAQAYDLEFKAVAGWTAPTPVKATVPQGRAVTAGGVYVRQTGSLSVTITPSGVVAAGARWRRAGTTAWLASGATEANVPVGNYWIEFLPLMNWKTPASVQVTISVGQTARSAGSYTRSMADGEAWTLY